MPMIDVTATEGTFGDSHALAQAVAEPELLSIDPDSKSCLSKRLR